MSSSQWRVATSANVRRGNLPLSSVLTHVLNWRRVMQRVLVVEDHDDTRELIAHALRGDGHRVVEARTGAEALEHYRAMLAADLPPDIVIADLRMPGMLGLSLVSGLRAAGCLCRALLITAYGNREVRAQANALDMETMAKPLDLVALRRFVREPERD